MEGRTHVNRRRRYAVLCAACDATRTREYLAMRDDCATTVLPMGDMTTCPQCGEWAPYTRPAGIIGNGARIDARARNGLP